MSVDEAPVPHQTTSARHASRSLQQRSLPLHWAAHMYCDLAFCWLHQKLDSLEYFQVP